MSALESAFVGLPNHPGLTQRLTQVIRIVADLGTAADFYCTALGFHCVGQDALADARRSSSYRARDAAEEVLLELGRERLVLKQARPAPAPYPADSRSNDLWFQHLAIVVADMDRAYAHLCSCTGWRPISSGGPQSLPPSSGGVRAFKFRDPDGHPLELLWFPTAQKRRVRPDPGDARALFLGIDHTALSIADTRRSLRFYAKLGWKIHYRSLNRGPSQARLDGLDGARVRVLGLRAASPEGPGIELLAYRPPGRGLDGATADSLASDCTALGTQDTAPGLGSVSAAAQALMLTDPDGHRLVVVDQPTVVDQPPKLGASTTKPNPPTSPKFFKNSQKCSKPSPSSNRQNPGKRQN